MTLHAVNSSLKTIIYNAKLKHINTQSLSPAGPCSFTPVSSTFSLDFALHRTQLSEPQQAIKGYLQKVRCGFEFHK